MSKRLCVLLGVSTLAFVSACTPTPQVKTGQYWQRINASESVYIRGPKAQQILNQDIARCVTELRELERLGQVRNAIPANVVGRVYDPDEIEMARHDTPERDGHLFAEHHYYQDFEGCMYASGWERAITVPFDGLKRAEYNYKANHIDYREKQRMDDKPTFYGDKTGDYND